MKFKELIREGLRNFLLTDEELHSPNITTINENSVYQDYLMYEAWAIGDTSVLSNIYKGLPGNNAYTFWGSVPDKKICKRHSGIPRIMIDAMLNIIADNYEGILFSEGKEKEKEIWDLIEKDNNFTKTIIKAVNDCIVFGEGAFKFTYISDVSKYPIIEFIPAKFCEIDIQYGRVKEIVFFNNTYKDAKGDRYILKEYYKKGCIEYKLFNEDGREVSLDKIPETANLEDIYFKDKDFMAAEHFKYKDSNKYEGHGESEFAGGKTEIFDLIDEIISQQGQTIRIGGPRLFLDDIDFIINSKTGQKEINETLYNPVYVKQFLNPNNSNGKPEMVQFSLNVEEYSKAITTFIVLALAGFISPSTVAIALQNIALISSDSGEAQREKEKQTLYTANKIKDALYTSIPKVIAKVLKLNAMLQKQNINITEKDISVQFAEYANPSFESLIETVTKANPGMKVLTTRNVVDELWGDTIAEEEKEELVKELNKLNYGVENLDEMVVQQNQKEDKKAIPEENE